MKSTFLPNNRTFWFLHCGALLALQLGLWLGVFLWQEHKIFNLAASVIWCIAFTEAVLLFRQHYQQKQGFSKRIWKRVVLVICYALVGGLVVSLVMLILVTPFFLSDLMGSSWVENQQFTPAKLFSSLIMNNTLQTQLFLAIWMFIYVSVTSNRRIQETEVSNLRLQNSLKEAQLTNLSNQLNPHFLFNAINNIRFTIYEDASKADTMLTGLSEMLRYSLERSKQDKVRLSEELEIIALYIDLIKVQMEDRLVFTMDITPDLYPYLIPPMTLQLLVENAVKHGIDTLRHGGLIELKAESTEQHIVFCVSNNRGHNNSLLSSDAAPNNIGIGLLNIEERLRLLYAENASLAIKQTPDHFSVILNLPKEHGI